MRVKKKIKMFFYYIMTDVEHTDTESEDEALTQFREERKIEIKLTMQKLQKKAIEKIYLDAKILEYRALIESNETLDNEFLSEARISIDRAKKLQKQKVTSEYYFVTVSPKQGTTLEALRKQVDKYVGRRMIVGSMYAYEWTKEKQVHVHLIVHQLECSDRDFRKNTKNTFKNLVGNLACIDVRGIPDDWIDDKKAYIKGEKWDEGKDEMIAFDKQKRIEENLEPFYTTGSMRPTPLLDEDA